MKRSDNLGFNVSKLYFAVTPFPHFTRYTLVLLNFRLDTDEKQHITENHILQRFGNESKQKLLGSLT